MVRHAEHVLQGRVLVGRQPGVPLSADGLAQAAALAGRFRGQDVDAVISSPIERARQTAAPIADALGLEVVVDDGLNEIDFGDWTGAEVASLEGDAAWDDWNRRRSLAQCPAGETMMAAQERALGAISRARTHHNVLMVSHQDVLKAVLAHYLGLSLNHLHRFSLDPASTSILTLFDDGTARVDGLNIPP